MVLLIPVSIVLALAAGPLTSLLLAGAPRCDVAAAQAVSARMLVVFAPQILLYGVAVALYGILQAHRRFTAPALAPVASSLVVIAAYVAFVPLGAGSPEPSGHAADVRRAGAVARHHGRGGGAGPHRARARRCGCGCGYGPRCASPAAPPGGCGAWAAVGIATLIAQDASLVVVMVLANGHGGQGALVLYNYGWQVFFVPYAVLAVPIATSAFPVLSRPGDGAGCDHTAPRPRPARQWWSRGWVRRCSRVRPSRCPPCSRRRPGQARQLAVTFAVFAPGLVGYGLSANLSRVLFACQRGREAAIALVSGWLLVIAFDVAAVQAVRPRWVVPTLALGNTAGLTVAGLALLAAVRVARGPAALRGSVRAAAAGLAGAVAGAAAGALVSAGLPATGFVPNAAVAALACVAAAAAFGAVAVVLDGRDLRALVTGARARLARKPA